MNINSTDLTPGRYVLTGLGDLGMYAELRTYVGQEVEVIKKLKSGLYYYIRTVDGKPFNVTKLNLEKPKEILGF